MRGLKNLTLTGLAILFTLPVLAQETENLFIGENGNITNLPTSIDLSERKPIEYNNPRADDILYQKVIVRVIDLREKVNFPLYFPVDEGDNRRNFFKTLLTLVTDSNNGIDVYEVDGNNFGAELFTENTKMYPREILEKIGISLEENTTYDEEEEEDNDNDNDGEEATNEQTEERNTEPLTAEEDSILKGKIKSSEINLEILKYYIKEVWYFDKSNSTMNVRILAICPKRIEDGIKGKALFWIPFNYQLRSFLAQEEILLTDKNNGARETIDDFFMKRKFGSYITKESNIMNRNLIEYNRTTDQARKEQERIKSEIFNFEQDLWEY